MLGADHRGQRLNTLYRENIDEAAILAALDPLFARYAAEREDGEGFGDFLVRSGRRTRVRQPLQLRLELRRMSPPDPITAAESPRALAELNRWLAAQTRRAARGLGAGEHSPATHALSSSFGAQAAVSLHLVTRQQPDIPVILIDTGYLFPETYRFVDELTERLSLNLKVYRPQIGIAWMEARFGKLWEQGLDGIDRYNRMRKVEPMQRALRRTRRAHLDRRPAPQPVAQPRATSVPANCATAAGSCIRSPTGATATCGTTCSSTTCPTTRCGTQGYVSIGDVHTTRRLRGRNERGRHAVLRPEARVRPARSLGATDQAA